MSKKPKKNKDMAKNNNNTKIKDELQKATLDKEVVLAESALNSDESTSASMQKRDNKIENKQNEINVVEQKSDIKKEEKAKDKEPQKIEGKKEKIAKEELGYVGEGERIFINGAGDQ